MSARSGNALFIETKETAIPIVVLKADSYAHWLQELSSFQQTWLHAIKVSYEVGALFLVPSETGALDHVAWVQDTHQDFWQVSALAKRLPAGDYYFKKDLSPLKSRLFSLAWGLGNYSFHVYKKGPQLGGYPRLVWPEGVDKDWVLTCLEATKMVRDLINEPAADLPPLALAQKASDLAHDFKATLKLTRDDELKQEYPCVYTVGKGSENPPCLIDFSWSHSDPKKSVTLVGKGVCFDSGGLDIKPAGGMLLMKKDMGGAAHVLGLAYMIMRLNLPIKLRVLIPAVENSVSGSAMRPLDIITTRKKTTVEIGNTDAEGRLILCDALYEAAQDQPDLLIDCATLTGAARIALGTELPGFFCNDDLISEQLMAASRIYQDPLWRLPLYQPYAKTLKGNLADLNNIGKSSYGGAITAALFLEHFVTPTCPWIHVDMMAWNLSSTPGRPEGGEAMGLRALWGMLEMILSSENP